MDITDELRLARYKLVNDRQKYFTELAKGTFASFVKIFTALLAGAIALVSAKSQLNLKPGLLFPLLRWITYLVTFLGVACICQIIFCLARWKGYRVSERGINPDSPPIKSWWWMFEGLYCLVIGVAIAVVWVMLRHLALVIEEICV